MAMTTTTDPGDPTVPPGKKTPAANYKAMKGKTNPMLGAGADPTKPVSATNPLMVQKADGSVGQWGNSLTTPTAPIAPVKKQIPLSDKAKGLSSQYFTPAGRQGPPVPGQKPSANFYN